MPAGFIDSANSFWETVIAMVTGFWTRNDPQNFPSLTVHLGKGNQEIVIRFTFSANQDMVNMS